MIGPTARQKSELCQALVSYFEANDAYRPAEIVRFLFSRSIAQPNERIALSEISAACPSRGTGDPDNNASSAMSRLYDHLDEYFANEGARQEWRIGRPKLPDGTVERGNFMLWYEPNVRPPGERQPNDLADQFWGPYLDGPQPVLMLYPELRSMMDTRTETYFRNPHWDKRQLLRYLKLSDDDNIKLSYSFVSSGLVAGMLSIIEYLNNHRRARIETRVIRPDDGLSAIRERGRNIILFGTPTSTELLTTLEESGMQTGKSEVIVNPGTERARPHEDDFEPQGAVVIQTKYGVLTRRPHPTYPNENVVTVLAGVHGRAVEGMANFLINKNEVSRLARMCNSGDAFPARFQALFKVELKKARSGAPAVQGTKLLKVLINRDRGTRHRRAPARRRAR
jgi:hypothetical protein